MLLCARNHVLNKIVVNNVLPWIGIFQIPVHISFALILEPHSERAQSVKVLDRRLDVLA